MIWLIIKILLVILGLLLLLLAGILFIPFTLHLKGGKQDKNIHMVSRAAWIPWLLSVKTIYLDKTFRFYLVILGIPLKIPIRKVEQKLKKRKLSGKEYSEKEKPPTEKTSREIKAEAVSPKSTAEEQTKAGIIKNFRNQWEVYYPFFRRKILPHVRLMGRYFHVKVKELDLTFGCSDPSGTGYMEGALYAIYPLIQQYSDKKNLSTRFIYYKSTLDFFVDVYFSMNLYGIVLRLFIIWWHYRKLSASQRRKSHESDTGETA